IYAANNSGGSSDLYTLTVNSSGVTLDHDYASVFWNPGRIQYDRGSGLVFSDDGFHVIDPATGLPTGIYEVGGGWPMAVDSAHNTVFILAQYVWQQTTNYTINVFDMTHYVRVAAIPFSTTAPLGFSAIRFLRWGTNGFAVSFKGDKIYLLSGSLFSRN